MDRPPAFFNHLNLKRKLKMKRILLSVIVVLLGWVYLMSQTSAQSVSFSSVRDGWFIARDSALTNSNTKVSVVFPLFLKTDRASTSFNSFEAARVLVMAKQTNDSVSAEVFIRVGQVTGGTAGTTYRDVLIDTLSATKRFFNVDLSSYAVFPQIAVVVKGLSAGNGVSAKWSAIAGAAGKSIVIP